MEQSICDKIIVTDHAVIRYMERVKGIDIEQYRRELQDKVSKVDPDIIKKFGCSRYIITGVKGVIVNDKLIHSL